MSTASRAAFALLLAATLAAARSRMPASVASTPAHAPAAPAAVPVGPTGVVLPAADPMASEMQREIERSQREYAALFQRLSLARSEPEALGIEEDMRQQRVGLQVSLLRIHAAYARRAGRNAFAEQLDRAIAALIAAEPPKGPAPDPQHRL